MRDSLNLIIAAVFIALLSGLSCAATEEVLHNFNVAPKGAHPASSLIADSAGNLYGATSNGGAYGVVFELTPHPDGTWTETVLHDFLGPESGGRDGAYPTGALLFDSHGTIYGATSSGGIYGNGTIFKMTLMSGKWKETVIHSFAGYPTDGALANGNLTFDAMGNLYGTTVAGGNDDLCGDQYYSASCGTVFELTPGSHGSWTETVLYNFQGGADGCNPNAGLVFDKLGNLYGTTSLSGGEGYACFGGSGGNVFELIHGSGGWTESTIYTFNSSSDGSQPSTGLLIDASGSLYGATGLGGVCCGVVFQLSLTGGAWRESVLYSFTGGSDGDVPRGDLAFDSAGNLYGAAEFGGNLSSCESGCGTVFKLTPQTGSWVESTLYAFTGSSDGSEPMGGVMLDVTGSVYATAYEGGKGVSCNLYSYGVGCGAVLKLKSSSTGKWTPKVLYDFPYRDDGLLPYRNLIAGSEGSFYGTTAGGGSSEVGTVFELTKSADGSWITKLLHNFFGGTSDGGNPKSDLVFDASGNLYGTTQYYGAGCSYLGCGIVFQLVPTSNGWKENVIYNFQIYPDGENPAAGVVFDSSGNLYGTTFYGGTGEVGTVFKLAPSKTGSWTETVIHTFGKTGDGAYPSGGLLVDKDGNLFGTTSGGGSYHGVVFELSPPVGQGSQWSETLMHIFDGKDGSSPAAALICDTEGNLYGTTEQGGLYDAGVVFKLTSGKGGVWTETVLHNFIGVNGDGAYPASNLIFDNSGNLYGTTTVGGIDGGGCGGVGCGTAFELTPNGSEWKEHILHRFTGGPDGGQPYAGFILGAAGNLYSTTSSGGSAGQGIVFEITPQGNEESSSTTCNTTPPSSPASP